MDKRKTKSYRDRLLARRESLFSQVTEAEMSSRERDLEATQDPADMAANAYTKELLISMSANDRKLLTLIDEALERVEALPFALTGGLFSRNPRVVEEVVSRSPVGNLYVNRAITGAMVGRQPFGGNRLSGTGTKAGGPDYLLHFVEPRVVTENTVRHGLVVDL